MEDIRLLRADEIECRAQIVKQKGCSLLLYKDARCDMKILDETFGHLGWEREHKVINSSLFCQVRIWDEKKKMWIIKEDVGTESYTEKEKGQASDAFKRACFNVGIGRELYTAPFIWINLNADETYEKNGKHRLKAGVNFKVVDISYSDREINNLVIEDKKGKVRYEMKGQKKDENHIKTIEHIYQKNKEKYGPIINTFLKNNNKKTVSELNVSQSVQLFKKLKGEK